MKMGIGLLAVAIIATVQTTKAFDGAGHSVVMQIALDTLKKEGDTKTLSKLEAIRTHDWRVHRRDFHLFAVWPDIVKHPSDAAKNLGLLAGKPKELGKWHFVAIPYDASDKEINETIELPGSVTTPKSEKTGNVVKAIRYFGDSLRIATTNDADNLSYLAHFVGDVHQPLHTVNVFKKIDNYNPYQWTLNKKTGREEYSWNDAGGNGFAITGYGNVRNLHAFWDDQMDLKDKMDDKPDDLLKIDADQIRRIATDLEKRYPKSDFAKHLKKTDPADWAKESYGYRLEAFTPPYSTTSRAKTKPHTIDEKYAAFAKRVVEERITLAGYRLSFLLQQQLKGR